VAISYGLIVTIFLFFFKKKVTHMKEVGVGEGVNILISTTGGCDEELAKERNH